MPRKNDPAYTTGSSVFASRLREVMADRGENQTTLASKITSQYVTIQRQTISLYMSGQSKPDTERLTAIAKVLKVSASWLLGLTEDKGEKPTAADDLCLSHDAIMEIKNFGCGKVKKVFDLLITDPDFVVFLYTLSDIFESAKLHRKDEIVSQYGPYKSDDWGQATELNEDAEEYIRKKLSASDAMVVYGDLLIDLLKFKVNEALNEIICGLVEAGRAEAEVETQNESE